MSNDSDDENTPPGSGPGVGGMPNNWLVPAVLLLLRDVSSYGYDRTSPVFSHRGG